MKKLFVVLMVSVICFFSGCNGYKEIDRGYLVTALGISQGEDQTNIYIEALSASDVEDTSSKRVVLSATGTSPHNALNNLSKFLIKPLYFEQLGTIVLNGNPSKDILRFLNDALNINFGVFVVKSDNVKSLFNLESPNGFLGYDIVGLIKNYENQSKTKVKSKFYLLSVDTDIPEIKIQDNGLVLNLSGEQI